MLNTIFRRDEPVNESIKMYAPGSAERASLERLLARAIVDPDAEAFGGECAAAGGTDARTAARYQRDSDFARVFDTINRHSDTPEMCSPPSTRMTAPLTQAASSSESR